MSDELPKGWANVPLKDFTKVEWGNTSITKKSYVPQGFAAFSASGQDGFLEDYDWEGPAVVLSAIGARCGKCFQADGKWTAIKNTIVIQGDPTVIDHRLLFYFLNDEKRWAISGTGQPFITMGTAKEVAFPFAPLPEQRRIVAKLETLLGKVDASQQRLAKIPVLLKRFRQSVLAAACSGRLTADWREENPNKETLRQVGDGEPPDNFELPNSWGWLLSSHAFDFVTSGSRGWARYYADDGPIFLRVGNLDHDSIQLDLQSIQHVRPPDNAEGKRTRVQVGDLLVSVTADVGMVALVDADIGEAYINQHVALTRPNDSMDRRYLAYFLSAKNGGQHQFLNLQRGATKVGLGLDDIKSIWIAQPPLPEQQEIVRRVEGLFALADQLEARLAKARGQVDKLTPSLLARAFAGKLVPQDPTDEPAEKLLERVQTERPAASRSVGQRA